MASETGKKNLAGDGMSQYTEPSIDFYHDHNPDCNCEDCTKYHKQ